EYRHNSTDTVAFVGGQVSYDVMAVGGMWEWRIDPSLTLTNALRLDHLILDRTGRTPAGYFATNDDWNQNLTAVSFNSGLVWKVAS
ncbi:hypothetical protein ACI4BE_29240, partial [Klebsiella pneumoniae]|uniref:hypothetical protein n=1 Tax=Klebsiella pneumoniae TaxID=573 RepID=UPI00385328DC